MKRNRFISTPLGRVLQSKATAHLATFALIVLTHARACQLFSYTFYHLIRGNLKIGWVSITPDPFPPLSIKYLFNPGLVIVKKMLPQDTTEQQNTIDGGTPRTHATRPAQVICIHYILYILLYYYSSLIEPLIIIILIGVQIVTIIALL